MGQRKQQPRRTGPFGLRGGPLAALAAGLYGSLGVSLLVLLRGRSSSAWATLLAVLLSMLVWGVLGSAYRYWGATWATRIHWLVPAAAGLLLLILLVFLSLSTVLTILGFVCAGVTLVSLPVAAVERLYPVWRRWRTPPDAPG